MKRFMKNRAAADDGFTLIEILTVVCILGVLAVIAIPNLVKFIGRGKAEAAATELAIVQTSLNAYQSDNPGATLEATSGVSGSGASAGILAPYLHTTLHGTYSWDETGKITQTGY